MRVQLITNFLLLQNTKITTSKKIEDKTRENRIYKANIIGGIIRYTEIIQNILKYPDIFMDLKYINISTLSLDLHDGADKKNKKSANRKNNQSKKRGNVTIHDADNGSFVVSIPYYIHNANYLPVLISHNVNDILTFYGVQLCKVSVDGV